MTQWFMLVGTVFLEAILAFQLSTPCLPKAKHLPDGGADYIDSLLDVFAAVGAAEDRLEKTEWSSEAALMGVLESNRRLYRCTMQYVSPYRGEPVGSVGYLEHASIQMNAGTMFNALDRFRQIAENFQSLVVEATDHPEKYPRGLLAKRVGEILADIREANLSFIRVTTLSAHVLVDYDSEGGKSTGKLTISENDRKMLLGRIRGLFGDLSGPRDEQTEGTGRTAGRLIYMFLTDKKWRSSDR